MSTAPKYDTRIRRKGGYQWASETDLEGLQFWCGVNSQSSKPEYAEKNKAEAKRLGYWVKYREAAPYECWRGIRGEGDVTALAPSAKPAIHSWDSKPTEKGDAWEGGSDDQPNW